MLDILAFVADGRYHDGMLALGDIINSIVSRAICGAAYRSALDSDGSKGDMLFGVGIDNMSEDI